MLDPHKTSYTLINRALDAGDQVAWDQLVEHYRRFICHVLHKMSVAPSDVDDLCQQVLISLTKNLSAYNRSKSHFRTWLSAVIRNAAISYFRKQSSYQRCVSDLREETESRLDIHQADLNARIEQEWAAYLANQALERIRETFQGQAIEVFELGLTGASASEVAEKTGLTVSTVYTLRKRVKKRLYLEVLELMADLEP